MKKILSCVFGTLLCSANAFGTPFTVCDFENYEIGHAFRVWNFYGGESPSTAIVEADPANPANKVLHITLKGWNDYVEFTLPDEYAGARLTDTFASLSLMVYRDANDPCEEWKHFDAILGNDKLYEDDGWPSQGPKATWMEKSYALSAPTEGNTSTALRLGYNSENTDYYIDNVVLTSKYDDFIIHESGELNFSDPSSTSSNYTRYSTPVNIPKDRHLNVYTSRYTYWTSDLMGEGRLNLHCGGERSYLGNEKGAMHPDWSEYTGDIHIYPYPDVNPSVKAGFYGLILAHGGKKFDSDNISESISRNNITTIWENNSVTLHDGATLSAESNNTARGYRIGTLTTEKGSNITGYYKNSSYRVYYAVGHSGYDSELAGQISATGNSKVGIIKEGKGTYTITGNTNNITGALSVIDGKVIIGNDVDEAKAKDLSGAIGCASNSSAAVTVYPGACLGGSGNIAGLTDIYGILAPGTDSPATLYIADFTGVNKPDLRLRPTSRLKMKIEGGDSSDCIDIAGNISYYNITASFQPSDKTPVIELIVPENHSLRQGDSFTLIKAAGKTSLNDIEWNFRVQYPKVCSWKVDEEITDGIYTLKATVTSTNYSGQGDKEIDDDSEDNTDNTDYYVNYEPDYYDPTPLCEYAQQAGKRIGVAASVWRYDINDENSPKVKAMAEQFNMLVAENEMKFETIQPERGHFDFSGADRIVDFAEKHSMYMRGHTLVWHSQCPKWVSSDGKKNDRNYSREELLAIMENHIETVAGHYKGRVDEWDVVNEMLSDDQSAVRVDPDAFTLRTSVWETAIGSDFIEKAFEYAHRTDPEAKLFINEYGAEFMGEPKSEALYNLAKYLLSKGVPLHGVGLQCHFTTGELKIDKLVANIRRYQELGLECAITELDIAQADPKSPDAAKIQATDFGALVNGALMQTNCQSVLLWGISDPDSWRDNNPLIYDGQMRPKEAYYAVHAALRMQSENKSAIEDIETGYDTEVVNCEYYNIQGMRVTADYKGLVIKREHHSDGTIINSKEIRR